MLRDLRYALRLLRRESWSAALIILVFAVGISGSTTIYALADSILWHPVPFADPDRLVSIRGYAAPSQPNQLSVPVAALEAWPSRTQLVSAIYTWSLRAAHIGTDDDAESATIGELAPGLISELGVTLRFGRDFGEQDRSARVAIIGDALWRGRFHAAADVIGRAFKIDGQRYTVIGVAPRTFQYPVSRVKLWVPTPMAPVARRVRAIARLRPGVSFEQAARLTEESTHGFISRSLPELRLARLVTVDPRTSSTLHAALGAACCLLLIAMANGGNLLLARAIGRDREIAIRRSIGATFPAVARQIVVDVSLLTAVSFVVAAVLSSFALSAIASGMPYMMTFQTLHPIELDWRALAAAAGLSSFVAIGAGLVPLARAAGLDLNQVLSRPSDGSRRGLVRDVLVVVQLAVTIVVIAAAGLLANSVMRLSKVDFGFNPERLSVLLVNLPSWRFPDPLAAGTQLQHLREGAAALPGVEAASISDGVPPNLSFSAGDVETSDGGVVAEGAIVALASVDDAFFKTLGIPIVAGRSFGAGDATSAPGAVVISRTLARRISTNGNAVGHRFRLSSDDTDPWLTVVGVTGDVRNGGFDDPRGALAIFSRARQSEGRTFQYLAVRTLRPPATIAGELRDVVRRTVPGAVVVEIESGSDLVAGSSSRLRFAMALMSALGVIALAVALAGIYGAFACALRQRRRELGVRLAIGAGPGAIVRMVLADAARLALWGVACGLPIALVVSRGLGSFMFEISTSDPLTMATVSFALVAAALVATYLPARQASLLDPAATLRCE
jgi:predicted permease